jgi:hypothetical protein
VTINIYFVGLRISRPEVAGLILCRLALGLLPVDQGVRLLLVCFSVAALVYIRQLISASWFTALASTDLLFTATVGSFISVGWVLAVG